MVTSPKIIGTIPITARLPYGTRSQLELLQPFFKAEAARASTLPTAPAKGMSRQVAASRRSRWKQEMQQLRRAGELTDTVIALVTGGLVKEIAGRGWDREWPDPPHQAYGGRWPGSPEGAWPEKLTVGLPADLVHTVRAACWNTSKEGIGQLYRWHERHPGARPHCRTRPGCTTEALGEYTQLASTVITPGVMAGRLRPGHPHRRNPKPDTRPHPDQHPGDSTQTALRHLAAGHHGRDDEEGMSAERTTTGPVSSRR